MKLTDQICFYDKIIELPNSLFDEIIQSIYQLYLEKGDTVIEVGSNIGLHTVVLGELVGSTGIVHAFEPFEENVKKLKIRTNEKGLNDNVRIYATALSNYHGTSQFKIFNNNSGLCCFIERPWYDKSQMNTATVDVNFIDNIFKDLSNLKLIKIDAEGADFDIIRGSKSTINKFRPLLIFEGGRIKDNPAQLYNYSKKEFRAFFELLGYEIYDTFGMRFNYDLWKEKSLNDFVAIPKEQLSNLENLLQITVFSVLLKYFHYHVP